MKLRKLKKLKGEVIHYWLELILISLLLVLNPAEQPIQLMGEQKSDR